MQHVKNVSNRDAGKTTNFIKIEPLAAELWRHIVFFKMAAIKSEIKFWVQV